MEKKTCSIEQFEVLVEYMESHRDLALGRCKSKEGRALSARLWTELSFTINAVNTPQSSARSAKEWAKYFTDYKARLNKKIKAIKASLVQTGGGQGENIVLSPLDTRLAAILGYQPGEGPSNLDRTRQLPLDLESQQEVPVPDESQQEVTNDQFEVIYDDNHTGYIEEDPLPTEEAINDPPTQNDVQRPINNNNSIREALLEMGHEQARANARMAAAMERIAGAIETMVAVFGEIARVYKDKQN